MTGDISSTPLIFFSRELILSLKDTFSLGTAQGTPTMLIILLRAVDTPMLLGMMSQCRHPCKWTSRSSQLSHAFPLHVLMLFLCMFV